MNVIIVREVARRNHTLVAMLLTVLEFHACSVEMCK